jgi:hypothetical protein
MPTNKGFAYTLGVSIGPTANVTAAQFRDV